MVSSEYAEKIRSLKNKVLQMRQERSESYQQDDKQLPSPIWAEFLSVFDYIINLSEENFLNIRYHTALTIGESRVSFWQRYPPLDPETWARDSGYKYYTEDIAGNYWISEPPMPKMPGPMGVNYRGKIINTDIRRYQCCISNLYSMGILKSLLEKNYRNLIFEVGGGYGGLAHHLGNMLSKNSTYIIIDLPEMLLFSGGYLIVNNPEKDIYVYEKSTFTRGFLTRDIYKHDYVLLPNYVLKDLYAVPEINLMINMESFQEMTKEQIDEYVEFAHAKLSGYIYSDNMNAHPFNNDLASHGVAALLTSRFLLFPPPEFYRKYVRGFRNPLSHEKYFGVVRGKDLLFPEKGSMKFMDNSDKYIVYNRNNKIEYKRQRDWANYLISLAGKAVRNILKQ